MGRGVDIPWVGGSIYHGYGVRYSMIRGARYTWVGGSIYHGYGVRYSMIRVLDIHG